MSDMQAENRRSDGKFAKGNKLGPRFKKGESGNPKGRPSSSIVSTAMRHRLAEVDPADPQKRTYAEVIADALFQKAKSGDVAAIREIADRVEGKAKQAVTLSFTERENLEKAIAAIMEKANCTRDEAIEALALFRPEARSLLNLN